jgi:acetolactate synthase-1/2/3 large subunit
MHSASAAFLEALKETGVSHLFANFGSDHPPILEHLAEAQATGRAMPKVITCPNEMVALSAAHGFAQVTGQAQAVIVHVECGTQSLAGAVHNAAKGRIPVLIFAGASPFTQEGELKGSRNEFIQWIQDVFDQRGLVRGYVKYENEIRTGKNVKQLVHRAMQFAHSEPRGPVYLTGAREVMEEDVEPISVDPAHFSRVTPPALAAEDVGMLVEELAGARRPLIVTSYLGRNPEATRLLVKLCQRLGIGVFESVPNYVNFPGDHPLYQGNQWNEPEQSRVLGDADVVLVIDSDVPWIPMVNKPRADARVFHIDTDPLKEQMPLWYIPALRSFRADSAVALRQLCTLAEFTKLDDQAIDERTEHYRELHEERTRQLLAKEKPQGDAITPAYLTARVRRIIDDDTIVLNEGITNYHTIVDHLVSRRPGGMMTSGGGSLGWNGGAAIGVKLAHPDKTVICLTGDGSYLFSIPAVVHWMARKYETPFLQIVYNNGGWQAPRFSMLSVHPDGYASRSRDIGLGFEPAPDYAAIATAAGGAFARKVQCAGELDEALRAALHAVQNERRSAVLDVVLAPA